MCQYSKACNIHVSDTRFTFAFQKIATSWNAVFIAALFPIKNTFYFCEENSHRIFVYLAVIIPQCLFLLILVHFFPNVSVNAAWLSTHMQQNFISQMKWCLLPYCFYLQRKYSQDLCTVYVCTDSICFRVVQLKFGRNTTDGFLPFFFVLQNQQIQYHLGITKLSRFW